MAGTAQRPKSDEPALSPNSNVTPLPTGVTPVLDKAPAVAAADYSVFELPGVNHPPALSPNSNVTPLPTGATPVLDKGPAVAAADYSVFELPAVNDPLPPPEARGLGPVAVVPKLQPPASQQASLPSDQAFSQRSACGQPSFRRQPVASPDGRRWAPSSCQP